MNSEAWVGVAAIIVTAVGGVVGWLTYVAWLLSGMSSNIRGMREDLASQKTQNTEDHKEIWKNIHELANISQMHESRLVRLETKNN